MLSYQSLAKLIPLGLKSCDRRSRIATDESLWYAKGQLKGGGVQYEML